MQTCEFCNQEREPWTFFAYVDKPHGIENKKPYGTDSVSICAWCLLDHTQKYYPESPLHLGMEKVVRDEAGQ